MKGGKESPVSVTAKMTDREDKLRSMSEFPWAQSDLRGPWGQCETVTSLLQPKLLGADPGSKRIFLPSVHTTISFSEGCIEIGSMTDMRDIYIGETDETLNRSMMTWQEKRTHPLHTTIMRTNHLQQESSASTHDLIDRLRRVGTTSSHITIAAKQRSIVFNDDHQSLADSSMAAALKTELDADMSDTLIGLAADTITKVGLDRGKSFFKSIGKDLNRSFSLNASQVFESTITFRNDECSLTVPVWQLHCLTQHLAKTSDHPDKEEAIGKSFISWTLEPELLQRQLLEFSRQKKGRSSKPASAEAAKSSPDTSQMHKSMAIIEKALFKYHALPELNGKKNNNTEIIHQSREQAVHIIIGELVHVAQTSKSDLLQISNLLPNALRHDIIQLTSTTPQKMLQRIVGSFSKTARPDMTLLKSDPLAAVPELELITICCNDEDIVINTIQQTLASSLQHDDKSMIQTNLKMMHRLLSFDPKLCHTADTAISVIIGNKTLTSTGLFKDSISKSLCKAMKALLSDVNPHAKMVALELNKVIKKTASGNVLKSYERAINKFMPNESSAASSSDYSDMPGSGP